MLGLMGKFIDFQKIMKKDIHPKYFSEAKIICACGNVITTGSVKEEMKVEVCSACHPFYTGKKRLVDSTGRVDRFKKRMEKSEQMAAEKIEKAKRKAKPAEKAVKAEKPAAKDVKIAKPVSKKKVAKKKVVKKK
jgi:large subunit ribosomal protein L31